MQEGGVAQGLAPEAISVPNVLQATLLMEASESRLEFTSLCSSCAATRLTVLTWQFSEAADGERPGAGGKICTIHQHCDFHTFWIFYLGENNIQQLC